MVSLPIYNNVEKIKLIRFINIYKIYWIGFSWFLL